MASSAFEVGKKLVALCNAHKNLEAVETLYGDDIVSIEAMAMGPEPKEIKGKAAVLAKNKQFYEMHEVHSSSADGPWPLGDRIAVRMSADVTAKAGPMAGQRMKLEEVALFTVKDGKITKEEFFYGDGR